MIPRIMLGAAMLLFLAALLVAAGAMSLSGGSDWLTPAGLMMLAGALFMDRIGGGGKAGPP